MFDHASGMRPTAPPEAALVYKTVGPFRGAEIPKGLLSEHRLKEDVWGRVTVVEGQLLFVWDDAQGGTAALESPAQMIVPPTVPHHLEQIETAVITVDFLRIENS